MDLSAAPWRVFRALPAYLGGKRRLSPLIFAGLARVVPQETWLGLCFLDPFLGGGSVSLLAKARGFDVRCNDLALRSAIVGRALIENCTVRLTEADVHQLLRAPDEPFDRTAAEVFSPSVFPALHARLLDRALHQARTMFQGPKRDLALLVLVKWVLRLQPMSMLRGTDARAAATGDLDRVSARRLGHYLKGRDLLKPKAFLRLADDVNGGVFPGCGQAYRMDALEFLSQTEGDIVYLDPPYPGTASYEREYQVLDMLLEGEPHARSPYSSTRPPLEKLLDACRHVPVWIVSYHSGVFSFQDLTSLVARRRAVRLALEIPYRHLGSIASAQRNSENRELLVIAAGEGVQA